MRRLIYLVLLAVFVGASVSCVSASTDCERWFVAYRQQLAHSRQLARVAAARRRAKLYAKRKLAGYVRPAPKPHPVLVHGPRMTPRQTLRHLDLACGVLPEGEEATPRIAEETPADFPAHPLGDGLGLLPDGVGDMVAENAPVAPPFAEGGGYTPAAGGPSMFLPPVGGYGPPGIGGGYLPQGSAPPGGGVSTPPNGGTPPPSGGTSVPPGGGVSTPPNGGTAPPSGGTSVPPGGVGSAPPMGSSTPPPAVIPPVPPAPPVAVVPEPATFVFMITGLLGASGVIRRRFQS